MDPALWAIILAQPERRQIEPPDTTLRDVGWFCLWAVLSLAALCAIMGLVIFVIAPRL
jgi:hypothetical protein